MSTEQDAVILTNLLSTKVQARPSNINIETKLLRPIHSSDQEVRFVFDRVGILSADSRLSLQQTQIEAEETTRTYAAKGDGSDLVPLTGNGLLPGQPGETAIETVRAGSDDATSIKLSTTTLLNPESEHYFADQLPLPRTTITDFAGCILQIIEDPTHPANVTAVIISTVTEPTAGELLATFAPPLTHPLSAGSTYKVKDPNSFVIDVSPYHFSSQTLLDADAVVSDVPTYGFDGTIVAGTPLSVSLNAIYISGASGWTELPDNTVTVGVTSEARQQKSVLPILTGINSLIESATFSIGGAVVCSVQSVGDYKTFKNINTTPEQRTLRKSIEEGLIYNLLPGSKTSGLEGVYQVADRNTVDDGLNDISAVPEDQFLLTADKSTSPAYSMKLGDLIPLLEDWDLPLFALREECSLSIRFSDNTKGTRYVLGDDPLQASVPTVINTDRLYIMADYIFYPELMDRFLAVVESGYNIVYNDIINIKLNEGATAEPSNAVAGNEGQFTAVQYTKQLGLGGKAVRSVVVQRKTTPNNLMGEYVSNDLYRPDQFNLRYNSENHYQTPLTNKSVMYNETAKVCDGEFRLNRYVYTYNGQQNDGLSKIRLGKTNPDETNYEVDYDTVGLSDLTYLETPSYALAGSQNWMGVDLRNSDGQPLKMSNLPILLSHTCEKTNYKANIVSQISDTAGTSEYEINTPVNVFCEVQKVLSLKNGIAVVLE